MSDDPGTPSERRGALKRAALALGLPWFGGDPAQAASSQAPAAGTPDDVVQAMLELAAVGPGDLLVDLGSGDGRIPIAAALLHGTSGRGVESDPQRLASSRAHARAARVEDTVRFEAGDPFEADLAGATVITVSLGADANLRLRDTLLALAPGTRIVSYDADMGDWTPDRRIDLPARDAPAGRGRQRALYLWVVPAPLTEHSSGRDEDFTALSLLIFRRYQTVLGGRVIYGDGMWRIATAQIDGGQVRIEGLAIDTSKVAVIGSTLESTQDAPLDPKGPPLRMHGRTDRIDVDWQVRIGDRPPFRLLTRGFVRPKA